MSLVTDFAAAMHAQAAPMIGVENVVIGATTLPCVVAEVTDGRDFSTGGFEPTRRVTAVCLSSALPAASLLQKLATVRSESFRVVEVSKGASHATLTLESITKA